MAYAAIEQLRIASASAGTFTLKGLSLENLDEHQVLPIFNTPLYMAKLTPCWPDILIDDCDLIMDPTYYVTVSRNRNILHLPEWAAVHKVIQDHVNNYFYNILASHPRLHPLITTSWLNKYHDNAAQSRHYHPNVEFTGCLYFVRSPHAIRLFTPNPQQSTWLRTQDNIYNSQHFRIEPEPGLLLIWPSMTQHDTEPLKEGERISLCFDVSVMGHRHLNEEPNTV
jgi:Putative 2OG-Fe(II) oxygenase